MDKETKRVVRAACARGWTLAPNNKHHVLLHHSGRKVTFSMSPSDGHASKQVQRDIERIEREYAAAKDFCSPDQCLCRVLRTDPTHCDMGVPRSAD